MADSPTSQLATSSIVIEDMSVSSLNAMAGILCSERKYDNAMQFFLQAAKSNNEDTENVFNGDKSKEKEYAQAELWFKKAAMSGGATAKLCLAKLYENGSGLIKRDYDISRHWYLDAADDNSSEAAYSLGRLHAGGIGVPINLSKACSWYEKAADLGNGDGAFQAGRLYCFGANGVAQNHSKTRKLYERAIDLKHKEASNSLGNLYFSGHCVPRNYTRALQCYNRSAAEGCRAAKYNMRYCYEHGLGVNLNGSLGSKYYDDIKEEGEVDYGERVTSFIERVAVWTANNNNKRSIAPRP